MKKLLVSFDLEWVMNLANIINLLSKSKKVRERFLLKKEFRGFCLIQYLSIAIDLQSLETVMRFYLPNI